MRFMPQAYQCCGNGLQQGRKPGLWVFFACRQLCEAEFLRNSFHDGALIFAIGVPHEEFDRCLGSEKIGRVLEACMHYEESNRIGSWRSVASTSSLQSSYLFHKYASLISSENGVSILSDNSFAVHFG
jgi:hypothetical protein